MIQRMLSECHSDTAYCECRPLPQLIKQVENGQIYYWNARETLYSVNK